MGACVNPVSVALRDVALGRSCESFGSFMERRRAAGVCPNVGSCRKKAWLVWSIREDMRLRYTFRIHSCNM